MKFLIAGGSGFLGTALIKSLERDRHETIILTRRAPKRSNQIQWDGKTDCDGVSTSCEVEIRGRMASWHQTKTQN